MNEGAIVNIDGNLTIGGEAKISVFDRGFLFGDSVYETLRTYCGHLFMAEEHLRRLQRSAEALKLALPMSLMDLRAQIERTMKAVNAEEQLARVIITRGTSLLGLSPRLALQPSFIIIAKPLEPDLFGKYAKGMSLGVSQVVRTAKNALDPQVKSGNYLNNILALRQAEERGFDDCIMCNAQGQLTELSNSNLFLVQGTKVRTPALSCGLLDGVTRGIVIGLCNLHGVSCVEAELGVAAIDTADEAFLTSTLKEILPIRCIENRNFAQAPGPITRKLQALFKAFAEEYVKKNTRRGDY